MRDGIAIGRADKALAPFAEGGPRDDRYPLFVQETLAELLA